MPAPLTPRSVEAEHFAMKAASLLLPTSFKPVHRGIVMSAARLWGHHRCWLMARWKGSHYLVLRADGRLFMCRFQVAAEVTATPATIQALFEMHGRTVKVVA